MTKINRIGKVGLALVFGFIVGVYGATTLQTLADDDPHIDDGQAVVPVVETFDLSSCTTQYSIGSADGSQSASITETPLANLQLVSVSISRDQNGLCVAEAEFELVN